MALTTDEVDLITKHQSDLSARATEDDLLCAYFEGRQRIEQLGMAVPPEYQRFLLIVNWPGVYVETIESRQDVRALILPDQDQADPELDELWDANNLDADLSLFLQDRYVYGRSFFSVGANEDDPKSPLIHVESPREMSAFVDVRKRRMTSAAKFYRSEAYGPATPLIGGQTSTADSATLYLPEQTVWVTRNGSSGWEEIDRDDHRLGRVPVTMSLCRRRSGSWRGHSLMRRVTGITDAAARALTNLQFASEAHGVPTRWVVGASQEDFIDKDGNAVPKWQAYFNAVWGQKNPEAKVGQFAASDLSNFETQLELYGKLAAASTLLPARFFGVLGTKVAPPSADAIRAEESQMVKFIERQNAQVGSVLGWTAALALRFASGDWSDGSRIGVEWHDPATPTIAQREDALMKRKSVGVLSRQGYWDELGWSEQRKAREQQYLDEEAASDPIVVATRQLAGEVAPGAPAVGR